MEPEFENVTTPSPTIEKRAGGRFKAWVSRRYLYLLAGAAAAALLGSSLASPVPPPHRKERICSAGPVKTPTRVPWRRTDATTKQMVRRPYHKPNPTNP